MGTPLRILILEDQEADAELVAVELRRAGFVLQSRQVVNEGEFRAHIKENWDVILADFSLPQFTALRALEILRQAGSPVPLIVVTGSVGEETAVECIKQGAADYLLKDRLARLGSAVRRALEEKQVREESEAAQRSVRENELRLRALIEHSSNGTLLLDRSGQVIHRYNDLLAGGQYQCANFLEWMVPGDRPAAHQMWDRLGQGIQTIQFRVGDGNGAIRWLEAVCNDLSDTECVQAVVVHYRDITEKRQLEEQFRQAQKMEAVGQLAAGLGHDFNNLLTIISGYSDLSRRHPGLPERVQKGLSEIDDACHRATKLTQELLTFSRKRDRGASVLDVNRAIAGLAPLLRSLLGESRTLKLNLKQGLARVRMDEGELGQIVMNLVVNARDALTASGTVTIETSNLETCNVTHSDPLPAGETRPPQIVLAVSDDGCGMDQAVQSRIFEPFFTTKDVGKGTGLGLSTVYAIVANASGAISVESTVGKGTTFRINLPAATESAAAPEPMESAPRQVPAATSEGWETILLVDDDDRVRDLMDAILSPLGYKLILASNAEEALGLWRATRQQDRGEKRAIHLLLTDIRMPGVKGTDLAHVLRHEQPDLKILFISGNSGMEAEDEQERLAGACLLAKPFSPQTLANKVREVLGSAPEAQVQTSVLIVDDDAKIRSLLRSVLETAGYSVQDTADGNQALARIMQKAPDVVLTDIVMPDMEGIELIKRMRKIAGGLHIIAMSGASAGYLQAARFLGADATIQKPIVIDELLELVHSLSSVVHQK